MSDALAASLQLSQTHYENFPVASLLLPARLRKPVALIYAFARQADDFADEGDLTPQQRLAKLDAYRRELDNIARQQACVYPLFNALAAVIGEHDLPLHAFYDLLDAFSQDVRKTRYADYAELSDYCRRSANPVGLLLLHLYRAATPANIARSNAICSSLQLINFCQDVAADYAKNRLYLPLDEMAAFGVTESDIARQHLNPAWRQLMAFQVNRAEHLLLQGEPLGRNLGGRIGLEMRLIIAGGRTILRKLRLVEGDVFRRRPVLRPWDWPGMLARASLKR